MTQIPKRLTPKTRKRRDHLPALTPEALEVFSQRLALLPTVSTSGKESVMQSMLAAANPNAEAPSVVIESLEEAQKQRVKAAQLDYHRTLSGMNARGKAALMQMTDEEFERRLNDSE